MVFFPLTLALWIGGVLSLLFGIRYPRLWIGFAVFQFVWRLGDLLLYRTGDLTRDLGAVAIGLAAAALAVASIRRLPGLIVIVGSFVAGASIALTILGTISIHAAMWVPMIITILAAIASAVLCWRFLPFTTAIIALSAITGAHILSNLIRDLLDGLVITGLSVSNQPELFSPMFNITDALQTAIFFLLAAVGIRYQRQHRLRWRPALGLVTVALAALVLSACAHWPAPAGHLLTASDPAAGTQPEQRPQITLSPDDRILVLVPHPDDEVLAAAGVIQRSVEMGLPVKVVYFTNGDYNEGSFALYFRRISLDPDESLRGGYVRYAESLASMADLGVPASQVVFLGYPDFGTRDIWLSHWGNRPPYRARFTRRNAVPYRHSQSPGAPYRGENILQDLSAILIGFKPTKIFTSHPGDEHPDHQALPLFLDVALWNLEDEIGQPQVYYFITHYGRWPEPKGLDPAWPNNPPAKFDVGNRWYAFALTKAEIEHKLAALKAHSTQWGSGRLFLESLVRRNESFDTLAEIPLDPNHRVAVITSESSAFPDLPLADLSPEDRAAFVDVDLRTIRLQNDSLVLDLKLSKPLSGEIKAQVHLASYRTGIPFAEMPKITIDATSLKEKVYERGRRLVSESVETSGDATTRQISVPLALLSDPNKVLLSAWVANENIQLDSVPWVVIDLSANP